MHVVHGHESSIPEHPAAMADRLRESPPMKGLYLSVLMILQRS